MPKQLPRAQTVTAFRFEANANPDPGGIDGDGVLSLRAWQSSAFDKIQGECRRVILAPTGSGKSHLIKALSAYELDSDPRRKVVIAIPQTLILRSFLPVKLRVRDKEYDWGASHRLVDDDGCIQALISFLMSDPEELANERTLLCTHHTLVLAHKIMSKSCQETRDLLPWDNVSLYIDEAHHSSCADIEEDLLGVDGIEGELRNRLGDLVAYFLSSGGAGSLTLSTATWFRRNLMDIVPKSQWPSFNPGLYCLPISEWLTVDVHFRFILGRPEGAFRMIYSEGNQKTIAYLPPVQSRHVRARGGKEATLESYIAAIGEEVRVAEHTSTLTFKPEVGGDLEITTLDLVTLNGREGRKKWLFQAIADGADCSPDLIWALNLGKEGFDYPALSRSIVVGERGSILDILQMLGRLLRSHEGKREVQFNMLLPYEGEGGAEDLRRYLSTILASMVIEWQFEHTGLNTNARARSVLEKIQNDPQLGAEIIEGVAGAAIKNSDSGKPNREIIEDALREVKGGDLDEEDLPAVVEQVDRLFSKRTQEMLREFSDTLCIGPEFKSDTFGCLRILSAVFNCQTLKDLRESWGIRPNLREEQILEWGEEHKVGSGKYPVSTSGPIPGSDETWGTIENALRYGARGLPGGSSLGALFGRKKEDLTEEQILAWAEEHKQRTRKYPNMESGPIPGIREVWGSIDRSLRLGHRGLSGNSSLSSLLGTRKEDLTEGKILEWGEEHKQRTGGFPNMKSGPIPGTYETWGSVNQALHSGMRGLPGGSSLFNLFGGKRKEDLTEEKILAWAEEHKQRTRKYPSSLSGAIPGTDETWGSINQALSSGMRGLPGGSSITTLLRKKEPLSSEKILAWAEEHKQKTGEYPNCISGPIPGTRTTWRLIDRVLREGLRGFPGGSSLFNLFGSTRNLTEEQILAWAEEHKQKTGKYPTRRSGPIPNTKDSWNAVDTALSKGRRGLPGGSTLAALLRKGQRRKYPRIRPEDQFSSAMSA
jgi:hypothetical protein